MNTKTPLRRPKLTLCAMTLTELRNELDQTMKDQENPEFWSPPNNPKLNRLKNREKRILNLIENLEQQSFDFIL